MQDAELFMYHRSLGDALSGLHCSQLQLYSNVGSLLFSLSSASGIQHGWMEIWWTTQPVEDIHPLHPKNLLGCFGRMVEAFVLLTDEMSSNEFWLNVSRECFCKPLHSSLPSGAIHAQAITELLPCLTDELAALGHEPPLFSRLFAFHHFDGGWCLFQQSMNPPSWTLPVSVCAILWSLSLLSVFESCQVFASCSETSKGFGHEVASFSMANMSTNIQEMVLDFQSCQISVKLFGIVWHCFCTEWIRVLVLLNHLLLMSLKNFCFCWASFICFVPFHSASTWAFSNKMYNYDWAPNLWPSCSKAVAPICFLQS